LQSFGADSSVPFGVLLADTDEECQFAALWAAIHRSPRRAKPCVWLYEAICVIGTRYATSLVALKRHDIDKGA
jgi:hypothetical protein